MAYSQLVSEKNLHRFFSIFPQLLPKIHASFLVDPGSCRVDVLLNIRDALLGLNLVTEMANSSFLFPFKQAILLYSQKYASDHCLAEKVGLFQLKKGPDLRPGPISALKIFPEYLIVYKSPSCDRFDPFRRFRAKIYCLIFGVSSTAAELRSLEPVPQ